MRILPILSAAVLTVSPAAFAQVTVDLHALQALPEHAGTTHPAQPSAPRTQTVVTRVTPLPTTQTPAAPQPAMPEAVPETATVEPIAPALPSSGMPPPPPPPVSDTAKTTAAATTAGLRLTFAPGASDLSPDSSESIKKLIQTTPPTDTTTYTVLAYAPGKPDDPSTARRISLSRAMAVRSALLADGIPSARIAARALGEQFGDGPPDRVDVNVTGATPNTAPSQ